MRRTALLLAGGAIWLLYMAIPAFADGGPHVVPTNSGTGGAGLAGDCAGCHRAHRGQTADLLKDSMPGLCLACHDGTGATTNVVDGIQYVPASWTGTPASDTVLGALNGGGFEYALIGDPARLTNNSRGGIVVTFAAAGAGTLDLVWPAIGAVPSRTLTVTLPLTSGTAAALQATVDGAGFWGTSTTYTSATAARYMSGTTTSMMRITVSTTNRTITFTPHNEFRVQVIGLPSVANNVSGTTATVTNGISLGHVGKVSVLNSGQAVTSTHMGEGTVWGNGPQGQGNPGATGVKLECTSCHNPHGNGQYRILNSLPGEHWANNLVEHSTTLTTALTAATDPIAIASAAGFPEVDFYIKVDSEIMLVTGGQGTLNWNVTRGAKATTAAAHSNGATVNMIIQDWTPSATEVQVFDVGVLTSVKNYTIKPASSGGVASFQASDVVGSTYAGDYWRYRYDPSGYSNFTNLYLGLDPQQNGWNGLSAVNADQIGDGATTITNATGITASSSSMTVASVTGFPSALGVPAVPFFVTVDSETMRVTAVGDSVAGGANDYLSWSITRAQDGTTAAVHALGANVLINKTTPEWNSTGLFTAWCITCHTRYNGYLVDATGALTNPSGSTPPSLTAQTPSDATFMFKHGTARLGCEQCHVQHGTNVTMNSVSTIEWPDGTPGEGSALLKVDNRGTCQMCHDPTGTVTAGTTVGTVPAGPAPGP